MEFRHSHAGHIAGATGSVNGQSGAAIPGATVTVTGQGIVQTLGTNEIGQYTISGLPPGRYTVRLTSYGFSPVEKGGIEVQPGKTLIHDGRDVAPRIGFAWAPGARNGRQKTVIRGGFGGGESTDRRYNLTLSAMARKVLNHVNPGPPVGNLTSPLFGQSLALGDDFGPGGSAAYNRRLEFQLRFSF